MITLYTVEAFNSARGIGNPLHDDDTAKALGYPRALVPGVDVYGYLTHAAVLRWGVAWLVAGGATCKLLKPVFDGDRVEVITEDPSRENLALELRVEGDTRAIAEFFAASPSPAPTVTVARRPLPAERPIGSEKSLLSGTELGTLRLRQSAKEAARFLRDQRESSQLYSDLDIVHPAYLLRTCNFALSRNVKLGPWIHAASEIRNFDTLPVGSEFELRTKVAANYEKRGHRLVDLEILALNASGSVASRILHTAVYAPRNLLPTEIRS